MKWVMHHEVSCLIPNRDKTLGDFFQSVLVLVEKITWYLLMVEGGMYPMELFEVHTSKPVHYGSGKKLV